MRPVTVQRPLGQYFGRLCIEIGVFSQNLSDYVKTSHRGYPNYDAHEKRGVKHQLMPPLG